MARTASTPFAAYATLDEAKTNKPEPPVKKDGTPGNGLSLYQIKLPGVDGESFVWARSPSIAIGQLAQHKNVGECVLAEKPERSQAPPAVRAKRAFAKLSDAERNALLAELMGTQPTNGTPAPAPQQTQPQQNRGGRKQHA
jgi:hypothetical protein